MQANLPGYARIIEDEASSRERLGLYGYIKQKLAWRDEVWPSMAYCAEAVEAVFLIDQVASDITTADALRLHGLADSENAFIELPGRGAGGAARNARPDRGANQQRRAAGQAGFV